MAADKRLTKIVARRNRELAFDALLKASLGVVWTCVVFGMFFWMGWFVGFLIAHHMGLDAWQFGALFTGLFLVAAIWSAWRRVDPLAGLQPLSRGDLLLTLTSLASGGQFLCFSPRHASAGFALVLIGGPAGLFEALGIWTHRIRADRDSIEEAARLLALCQGEPAPVEDVEQPAAAVLLKRLALVKIVPNGHSVALALTEKGETVLGGRRIRKHQISESEP